MPPERPSILTKSSSIPIVSSSGGRKTSPLVFYLIDPATGLCTFQFTGLVANPPVRITDGLALDPSDGTIWHAPDVCDSIGHFTTSGLYPGSLTPRGPTGAPDRDISGIVVGPNDVMYVAHDGQGRITVVNKVTGAWIRDLASLPARVLGMECDIVNFAPATAVWYRNAFNNTVVAIEVDSGSCGCSVTVDTCRFFYNSVDMGSLPACSYPTALNNPAHGLSGVAWLGSCVTADTTPHGVNLDGCNDGVTFLHGPWHPCRAETLAVTVTAGPQYIRYAGCGGQLFLNGWKDGNVNGSFCDELVCDGGGVASEWIVQDLPVGPGTRIIPVLDPGVRDIGAYAGVFRFRLTSHPVGRFGFGQASTACPVSCGTFALDSVGEVEDYTLPDFQLAVLLNSLFAEPGDESVTLNWATASESANDHFEILRDGASVAHIPAQGSATTGHTYRFTDSPLANGTVYRYSLVAVDANGEREELRSVTASPTAAAGVVMAYALRQNFPNPFNPSTEISFDLVDAGRVRLSVYDLLGKQVAVLVNSALPAGRHQVAFDGRALPSGIYIYRLSVNGFVSEKKMLLMK